MEIVFSDLKDAEGNHIPCVRLTDQSADGYFYTMLRDTDCDIAVNIDEDAFIVDPQAVLDLVDTLLEGGYANIGCSDGDPATTGRDPVVTNPFFNIFNLQLIRTRFDRKALVRKPEDREPYYPFFHWLAATFPTLYLPARRHADGITTIALDPQGRVLCLHTWFSRFYSMPSWIVRASSRHRERRRHASTPSSGKPMPCAKRKFPVSEQPIHLLSPATRSSAGLSKYPSGLPAGPTN